MYFVSASDTPIAEQKPDLAIRVREELLSRPDFVESSVPDQADFLVLQEDLSFKEWRYSQRILNDPLLGRFPHKTLAVSRDDSCPGLYPGVYACLQSNRFSKMLHRAAPYLEPANPLVEKSSPQWGAKKYLASWRGNTSSNKQLRLGLVRLLANNPRFCIETSDRWFNHGPDEHERYINLIQSSSFSLCPAGLAATTFRIYDSMALGVCPVILADLWVPPDGPRWNEFGLFIKQKSLSRLEEILKHHEPEAEARGRLAYDAWCEFFAGPRKIAYLMDALASVMTSLPPATPQQVIARWQSHTMYHSNGWTLPQRLVRRANALWKRSWPLTRH